MYNILNTITVHDLVHNRIINYTSNGTLMMCVVLRICKKIIDDYNL